MNKILCKDCFYCEQVDYTVMGLCRDGEFMCFVENEHFINPYNGALSWFNDPCHSGRRLTKHNSNLDCKYFKKRE